MPRHCEGGGLSSDLMHLLTCLNVPLYREGGREGERGEEQRREEKSYTVVKKGGEDRERNRKGLKIGSKSLAPLTISMKRSSLAEAKS